MQRPTVVGTVSAISGTNLTVTSKNWAKPGTTPAAGTTYTVNATNATVTKAGAVSSVSAIAVGDMVMIQGTVSGTNVTATKINDGVMNHLGQKPKTGTISHAPIITGNGQPVIGGSVTAISGSTLTVTNKSNVTYTVDATNAVIEKGNATSTISNIATGDNVVVQGTVNGTSVTASSVIDQGATPTQPNNSASTTPEHRGGGIFSAIGGFFSHLFGFF
jgi:hypothetical protein